MIEEASLYYRKTTLDGMVAACTSNKQHRQMQKEPARGQAARMTFSNPGNYLNIHMRTFFETNKFYKNIFCLISIYKDLNEQKD